MSEAKPSLLSHSPLLTLDARPFLQVNPPFDRRYGGSTNIKSTKFSGNSGNIFKQLVLKIVLL